MLNQPQNSITKEELIIVINYFEKLGYKSNVETIHKLEVLAIDYPDKDFVKCAHEMYEWFSERSKYGRKIKSYHSTFRNWVKKDYAPKKNKQESGNFFERSDLY